VRTYEKKNGRKCALTIINKENAKIVGIIQIRARIRSSLEYQRIVSSICRRMYQSTHHHPIYLSGWIHLSINHYISLVDGFTSPPTIISMWLDSPTSRTTVTIPTPIYPDASRYFGSEATYNIPQLLQKQCFHNSNTEYMISSYFLFYLTNRDYFTLIL
jgi:hypothetical protein